MIQTEGRNIYLFEEINADSVKSIVMNIMKINTKDATKERNAKKEGKEIPERPPINLVINSIGGSVRDALLLCDVIRISKTPIHTIGMGMIASAAVPVFVSANQRKIVESTRFMMHKSKISGLSGSPEYVCSVNKQSHKLERKLLNKVVEATELESLEKVYEKMSEEGDYWIIDSDEAIKLKFADVILEELPQGVSMDVVESSDNDENKEESKEDKEEE